VVAPLPPESLPNFVALFLVLLYKGV